MICAIVLAASLWGNLEAGPHAAGFTQLERYDASRPYRTARTLDGVPRVGERGRPIKVSVWYPAALTAAEAAAAPLTFGDYADMTAGETRFELHGEGPLFNLQLLNTMTKEQRAQLRSMPSRAIRDARPAAGKFPLILYSLGSTALAHVTPEYLASHGYVVIQSPRAGAFAGFPPDNRDALDLETKLRDVDFLMNVARTELPHADLGNIGAIGFSAGGRWALAAAMKNPDVHAVVSLDSVMLFGDPVTEAWKQMPHFNLESVRVPVLHMVRSQFAKLEDPKMWEGLRYADRTYMLFDDPALDHLDFQSIGYATSLTGLRAELAPKIAANFDAFNRITLAFLDAQLKGRSFTPKDQPGIKVTHLAAQPAPFTAAELMNAVEEDGADAAINAYRRAWKSRNEPPVAEAALNLAGYTLLFSGRAAEGLRLLALNAEACPSSANVYDSLADAYLAVGEKEKAVELAKKAAVLLDADTTLTPERRAAIKGSIEGKLK
jgi:pimeloyl-ACP methyl ester carboxylesterase